MKKKIIKCGICLTLSCMLMLSGMDIPVRAAEGPEGMRLITENDNLALYINEETTACAVVNRSTGDVFYTNPPEADNDTVASGYHKRLMKSQLDITYYNEKVQVLTMDNYTDCIQDGQFEIVKKDDGVTVIYTIGETASKLLLPEAISEERYAAFVSLMDSSVAKKMNRNYVLVTPEEATQEQLTSYPSIADKSFYILRGGVKDYLKEELSDAFKEAGYTIEDLEADKADAGGEKAGDSKPWFIIPLNYELFEDSLKVSVNPDEIEYNEDGFYLVDIDILPFFGADSGSKGYMFVPDGSGALINFNNGKTAFQDYSVPVYGQDNTKRIMATSKSEIDPALTVKMPVFGIKSGNSALFAIIEDGAAYADISASVSGKTSSYNNIYAGFSFLQYGSASLGDMVGSEGYQLYSGRTFASEYGIRYIFLSGDKADYSGMAEAYRDYLTGKGYLSRNTEKNLPLFIEFIGAIDKYKTTFGIKYSATVPVTTYAQAERIVTELKGAGIDNLNVVYSGWANGGLHGTAITRMSEISALKSEGINTKKFVEDMGKLGVETFMGMEFQYVYKDKAFDGYSELSYSPGYFDNTDVFKYSYKVASDAKDSKLAKLISPAFADKITDFALKWEDKFKLTGISLGSISWDLYSDFERDKYVDRQDALTRYEQSFNELSNECALLSDNGNIYSLIYSKKAYNVPLYSNGFRIIDTDVPFYEMVLHGTVPYAGSPLNMADDYSTDLLKCVESGAGLSYKWIYEDNSVLKETDHDFDKYYSVNYKAWIETAERDYLRVNAVLGDLNDDTIIRHEKNGDVSITTYSDGTKIYVNYAKTDVTLEGIVVPARDFVRTNGR